MLFEVRPSGLHESIFLYKKHLSPSPALFFAYPPPPSKSARSLGVTAVIFWNYFLLKENLMVRFLVQPQNNYNRADFRKDKLQKSSYFNVLEGLNTDSREWTNIWSFGPIPQDCSHSPCVWNLTRNPSVYHISHF